MKANTCLGACQCMRVLDPTWPRSGVKSLCGYDDGNLNSIINVSPGGPPTAGQRHFHVGVGVDVVSGVIRGLPA